MGQLNTTYFNTTYTNIKLTLLTILIFGINSVIFATRKVLIVDSENKPLSGVLVSILSENNSEYKDSYLSDEKGLIYVSDSVSAGSIVYAQLIGFNEYTNQYNSLSDTICLTPKTTELSEIVVLGNKDLTRVEAGKLIFTPGSLKTQVSNGLDILKYVPLVSEDQGNSFKVLGKSCHILINGKEPQVSQDQVMIQLKSVPAEWIQSIEVMPNPGSLYQASGNIAVVNIKINDMRNGTWITTNIGANAGDHEYGNYDSGLIYYTHKKIKISAFGMFNFDHYYSKSNSTYNYMFNDPENNLSITNLNTQISKLQDTKGELFVSYQINKKNRVGGGISIFADKQIINNSTSTSQSNQHPVASDEETSYYIKPWTKPQLFSKIFYILATDQKGSYLDISGIYRHGKSESYTKYSFAQDMNELRNNTSSGGSATIAYNQVFNPTQTLKGGYNYQTTKNTDTSQSALYPYTFNYDETIHAGYIQLESLWNQIISSTIGVRLESDKISGIMSNGGDSYHHTDTGIFPSVNFNIMFPGGNHYIMFSAERSIFRPQFYDLNPYVLWTSDNTCKKGNPNLKAATSWNIDAMYLFFKDYIIGLNYSYNKDLNSLLNYGVNGVSFTTNVNRPIAHNLHIMFEYNKQICNIWRLRAKFDGRYYYSPFIYEDRNLTDKSLLGYMTLRNSLFFSQRFIPNINFVVQFGYRGQQNGIGRNWIANMKFNFSKEIFSNLDLDLSVSYDPLSNRPVVTYMENYKSEIKKIGIPISSLFNITYSFGRKQIDKYKSGGDDTYNSRF